MVFHSFNILDYFTAWIAIHNYFISFLGGALSEEFVVFFAILSGRGVLPFWVVFVFGSLGALFINFLWFLAGGSVFGKRLSNWLLNTEKKIEVNSEINYVNKKKSLIYLIATKFVYGTRSVTAVYYGMKGMSYRRFLIYDSIAILVWASIMVSAGWLAGKGFDRILRFTKGFDRLLAIILLTLVIIYFLNKLIRRLFVKNIT